MTTAKIPALQLFDVYQYLTYQRNEPHLWALVAEGVCADEAHRLTGVIANSSSCPPVYEVCNAGTKNPCDYSQIFAWGGAKAPAYHIQEIGSSAKTFVTGLEFAVATLLAWRKEGEATNRQYILLGLDGFIIPSSEWPEHLRD